MDLNGPEPRRHVEEGCEPTCLTVFSDFFRMFFFEMEKTTYISMITSLRMLQLHIFQNMHFYPLSESPAFSQGEEFSNFTCHPLKRGLKRIAQIMDTYPM